MARTALDLTAEELRSYRPDRKLNEWQVAERWGRAWESARMAARLLHALILGSLKNVWKNKGEAFQQ